MPEPIQYSLDSSTPSQATRQRVRKNQNQSPQTKGARRWILQAVLCGMPVCGFSLGCGSGQVPEVSSQNASPQNLTDGSQKDAAVVFHSPSDKPPKQGDVSQNANPVSNVPFGVGLQSTSQNTNRSPSPTPVTAVSQTTASVARQWMDAVIERYRKASSYSDAGYVRLSYRRLGERFEDKAPLAVQFIRGKSLHVQAYASEMVILDGDLQATITDPLTNNMDGQVLRNRLTAGRFALADIYADAEWTHFASAGLGGPSPQLELLLSDKPLAGLFEGKAELSMGPVESLATNPSQATAADPAATLTQECQTLVIETEGLVYRLWIDKSSGLLRRIELPIASAGLAADPAVTDVQLSIELDGARFSTLGPEAFRFQAVPRNTSVPKFVRSFVPLPPPLISDLLGQTLPEFALSDASGRLLASERGSDRKMTVLLWIADHPASRMAASQLQMVADTREGKGQKDCRIAVVMAEPQAPPAQPTSDTLVAPSAANPTGAMLRSWRVGLPFSEDVKAVGRDTFKIAEAPTLVVIGPSGVVDWFQPRVGPDLAVSLPMLLDDLAAGKTVGKDLRAQYEKDQQTYRQLLSDAAAK
jgi:hypothetical protein